MKQLMLFVLFSFLNTFAHAQTFRLKITSANISNRILERSEWRSLEEAPIELKLLQIATTTPDENDYEIRASNIEPISFKGNNDWITLSVEGSRSILDKRLEIWKINGASPQKIDEFTVKSTSVPPQLNTEKLKSKEESKLTNEIEYWENAYNNRVEFSTYGIRVTSQDQFGHPRFVGPEYIHIFLDQYGKPMISAIPNGIPNIQYVVHIIHPIMSNTNEAKYFIVQKSGSYSDGIKIYGESDFKLLSSSTDKSNKIINWRDEEFLLRLSSDEIKFEINKWLEPNDDQKSKPIILGEYTIKMLTTYHVSLNAGLLNTKLANPKFSLLPSATNANEKVVKIDEDESRGVATLMASFYTSPIVLLKNLFGNKQPFHKMSGRNFLADHTLLERIYPTVGVGISEKALENLFLGLNWEFARGGSIYFGYHFGKVRTFDADADFKFGITPVTDNDFQLRQHTRWQREFAFGINIDFKIMKYFLGGDK